MIVISLIPSTEPVFKFDSEKREIGRQKVGQGKPEFAPKLTEVEQRDSPGDSTNGRRLESHCGKVVFC